MSRIASDSEEDSGDELSKPLKLPFVSHQSRNSQRSLLADDDESTNSQLMESVDDPAEIVRATSSHSINNKAHNSSGLSRNDNVLNVNEGRNNSNFDFKRRSDLTEFRYSIIN